MWGGGGIEDFGKEGNTNVLFSNSKRANMKFTRNRELGGGDLKCSFEMQEKCKFLCETEEHIYIYIYTKILHYIPLPSKKLTF